MHQNELSNVFYNCPVRLDVQTDVSGPGPGPGAGAAFEIVEAAEMWIDRFTFILNAF